LTHEGKLGEDTEALSGTVWVISKTELTGKLKIAAALKRTPGMMSATKRLGPDSRRSGNCAFS